MWYWRSMRYRDKEMNIQRKQLWRKKNFIMR